MEHHSASIIILNYNYARFLTEAIDSALAQTYPNVEVIVVDDGSIDDSRQIIASYGERIRPLLKTNGGQGSACNAGFAQATGDVIFFLDSDDAMLPETVATVLEAWRPGVVMTQYRLTIVDGGGRAVGIHPDLWEPLDEGDVKERVLKTGGFATSITSGLAFSRATLQHILPLPETVITNAADGYLVRAAALFGPVQTLDQPLALYRRHGGNDSDPRATAGSLAEFFRKKIRYMRNEHNAVRTFATKLGLPYAEDLGEKNSNYLNFRLLSIALDPTLHPVEGDRQLDLLVRYLRIRCREHDPVTRRLADAATAIGLSVLPEHARTTLVRWRHLTGSRPPWLRHVDSLLKRDR